MALVIDLSFMLPRLDFISSSSSAGRTKWNTLSSSNNAFPSGNKQHFWVFYCIPFHRSTVNASLIIHKMRVWQLNAFAVKVVTNHLFWNVRKKTEDKSSNDFRIISNNVCFTENNTHSHVSNESGDVDKSPWEKTPRHAFVSCVQQAWIKTHLRSSWFSWFWS